MAHYAKPPLDRFCKAVLSHHRTTCKLQYPIYATMRDWTKSLFRLRGLAELHREMLLRMQPFNSDPDANFLGWLNDLARVDRHRRLNEATAYIAEV